MRKEKPKRTRKKVSGWLKNLDFRWDRLWSGIPKVIKCFFFIGSFIGVGIFLFFMHEIESQREQATFVAYLIGGGLFVLQIYISNRRVTAAENTAKAMQKTASSAEKGNTAERFKNAIEHLGSKSASIRFGGVYALHNLAREEDDYCQTVFEILCAHIRETTTQKNYKMRIGEFGFKEPTIEIQSILNLLFVEENESAVYYNQNANLEGANLQGANLKGAWLGSSKLSYANLEGAMLMDAKLNHVSMDSANLKGSTLSNVNAISSRIISTNMQHCNLSESDFRDADLSGCNLQHATMFNTNFDFTHLGTVDFRNSWFYGTNLHLADLSATNLESARFDDVKNLEVKQLLASGRLYKAKLPNGMEEKIKKEKPELFEDFSDIEET